MDEISELARRAEMLRLRFLAFVRELGEFAPPLVGLRAELDEIEEHLAALGENGSESAAPEF